MKCKLVAIFNTHQHNDRIAANQHLIQKFPQVKVYGGAEDAGKIPGQQVFLQQGDRIQFADRVAEVIFVTGHTCAHIAYYFPPQTPYGVHTSTICKGFRRYRPLKLSLRAQR